MKVRELMEKLANADPESKVLIVESDADGEVIQKAAVENGHRYTMVVGWPDKVYLGREEGESVFVPVVTLPFDDVK